MAYASVCFQLNQPCYQGEFPATGVPAQLLGELVRRVPSELGLSNTRYAVNYEREVYPLMTPRTTNQGLDVRPLVLPVGESARNGLERAVKRESAVNVARRVIRLDPQTAERDETCERPYADRRGRPQVSAGKDCSPVQNPAARPKDAAAVAPSLARLPMMQESPGEHYGTLFRKHYGTSLPMLPL